MLSAVTGGIVVVISCLIVALLRRSGRRTPRPLWMRSDALESWISIGLVAGFAIGFAMVVKSASTGGLTALVSGAAVGVAGSGGAVLLVRKRAPREGEETAASN